MAARRAKGDGKRPHHPTKVLAIDVGGTNVKILVTGKRVPRKVPSGPSMTASGMVAAVKQLAGDWSYDVISLGYPGAVLGGRPAAEPKNLSAGWVKFDFAKAFGCPVKVINDAAMQALGSYEGGRMLFLGLGTGLGSALITDGVLVPMELAHLRYRKIAPMRTTSACAGSSDTARRPGAGTSQKWLWHSAMRCRPIAW